MDDTLARRAIREAYGADPEFIEQVGGGLANHVWKFSVGGKTRILRVAPEAGFAAGTTYWLSRLERTCLTIPHLEKRGMTEGFSWTVLSLVPGQDLGTVYDSLTDSQKRKIASSVIECQRRLATLPRARGYGFLSSYDDTSALPRWTDVITAHINRSRSRLLETGAFPSARADEVESLLPHYAALLEQVEPIPFFDDATTKNVLVREGAFSGIVDLDWLCFGDRLYATALTKMSLLAAERDVVYADYLLEADGVYGERLALLDFYVLVFCLDFMSECGMAFNKERAAPVDPGYAARLTALFADLSGRCTANRSPAAIAAPGKKRKRA